MDNYRTVCISGPTSAAIDAIRNGIIVLWVPYIWDDGILLDDMMNCIGVKCENRELLRLNTKDYLSNVEHYKKKINIDWDFVEKNFSTNKMISDVL
jgi:hypothetical protein